MDAKSWVRILVILSLVMIPGGATPRGGYAPPRSAGVIQRAEAAGGLAAAQAWWALRVAWHAALLPSGRGCQEYNPARNRQRWQRRYQRWWRQRPPVSRRRRRARQRAVLQSMLGIIPPNCPTRPVPTAEATVRPDAVPATDPAPAPVPIVDPLAALRQSRGWIDRLPEAELWALLRQVRWANGLRCPHCGETSPTCLEVVDRHYRGGMYRYRCLVCAVAGDPGEGGTFTDLSGTLFGGSRLDIRSLWLIIELFVEQAAAVETAREVRVNRHTVDRYFRLLRGALYQARAQTPIALTPEDIVEGDEVYLTAGLKGRAGHHPLQRAPRRRGLKRRGRGTWDSDRVPIFGLVCRGGQVRLFTLPNVRTATIRPILEQMVQRGVTVYTDSYDIYNFLEQAGYPHATVNHAAGEYARGEVHCNTVECVWSWLRQMIRTYRGVSKVYLPLYVAQFEFFYNRRRDSHWSQMLDVLSLALQANPHPLLDRVNGDW